MVAPAGAPAGQRTRGGQGGPPATPRRVELRNLADGRRAVVAGHAVVHLRRHVEPHHSAPSRPGAAGARAVAAARRRRRAAAPGGAAQRTNPTGPRGSDVIFTISTTGRDQLLGSVGEISFNKKGDLLAYTVDAAVRDGNGLFVLDLAQRPGAITLDNDARVYSRLTWNDDGTGLAVLKGVDVDKMRERDNILLVVSERAGGARRSRVRAGRARSVEGRRIPARAGS